jgi:hypothetical protein
MNSKKKDDWAVMLIEDRLDVELWKCLEIMELPSRKRLTIHGLTDVFPSPVFNENGHVTDIEYLPVKKTLYLPDKLYYRFIYWDYICGSRETKLTLAFINRCIRKYASSSKSRYTEENKKQWIDMKASGMTVQQIVNAVGCSRTTITGYLKKYKAMQEGQSNELNTN